MKIRYPIILGFILLIVFPILPLSVFDYDGTMQEIAIANAPMDSVDVSSDFHVEKSRTEINENRALIIGAQQLSGNFSPFFAETQYDKEIVEYTQAPLVNVDESGNIIAGVDVFCVAYEYLEYYENDVTTYEFTIKNGITFSDGHVIDSNDVLFNLYVYLDPLYDGTSSLVSLDILGLSEYRAEKSKKIEGIKVYKKLCDDGIYRKVVTVKINGTDSSAASAFVFPVAPMHHYSGEERHDQANARSYFGVDFASAEFMNELKSKNSEPLGAGPYKIHNINDAGGFYQDGVCYFVANDIFMLGAPEIKNLHVKTVSSIDKKSALLSNEIHVMKDNVSEELISSLWSDISYAKLDYKIADSFSFGFVAINADQIKNDLERKALISVFDTSLCSSVYGAATEPLHRPMSSVYEEYPENAQRYYQFDATAKIAFEYYTEIGYSIVNGVMIDGSGTPVEYVFSLPASTSVHPAGEIFLAAQKTLSDIGIKVTITVDTNLFENIYDSNVDVWAAEIDTGYSPDLFPIFCSDPELSSSPFPRAFGLYDLYYSGTDAEKELLNKINEKIISSRKVLSPPERNEEYLELLDLIMDTSVILPTYQKKTAWVYDGSIINSSTVAQGNAYHSPFYRIWEISFRN